MSKRRVEIVVEHTPGPTPGPWHTGGIIFLNEGVYLCLRLGVRQRLCKVCSNNRLKKWRHSKRQVHSCRKDGL